MAGAAPVERQRPPLSDYEGIYAYSGNTTLAIVATDRLLYAIIDEAKYPLRPLGNDRVVNGSGDTIPFRRAPDGVVSGFVEHGILYARRSAAIDSTLAASVRAIARPIDANGNPTLYTYKVPTKLSDGLRTASLTEANLDTAAISRLVNRIADGTYPDVHSILVYRGDALVVEEYFYGYDRNRPHQLRSASKSIVSALVGIAIGRGAISSDTVLVTPLLPYESYANPDARRAQLRLRDLLTMRSGFACDDWDQSSPGNESRVYESDDWVKFVLDLPIAATPGTAGHYCSGNVAIVGRIVERATGKPLPAFAQENLFTPLGIRAGDVKWNYTLSSSNAATFAQVYLRPRDMLKLGVLFAQQGRWNGEQIITSDWVSKSTAPWSTVGDQQYGYFWWHQWVNAILPNGSSRRVDMVVATGNGGQKIFLVPTLDLIVVMTGGNYNTNSPATAIMARELLPALLKPN